MNRITMQEYEKFVTDFWYSRREDDPSDSLRQKFIMTVGLGGETGEVLELLKKEVRDGKLDVDELALELGDVVYYVTKIALTWGFTLEEIMVRNKQKLEHRHIHGKAAKEGTLKWAEMSNSENTRPSPSPSTVWTRLARFASRLNPFSKN